MSRTMFLVVRRAVQADGAACHSQHSDDTGSRVPLRMFATRPAAEQFVATLAAEAQRTTSPFHLNVDLMTEKIRKQLDQLRFPVECPKRWDRLAWWDQCADLITDEERAAVWALFGKLAPFEVLEIEV